MIREDENLGDWEKVISDYSFQVNEGDCGSKWGLVIDDFFKSKKEIEAEKILKTVIKEIEEFYKGKKHYSNKDKENFFNPRKNKKESSQSSLDFQKELLLTIYRWKDDNGFDFDGKLDELKKGKIKIDEKFEARSWLSWASDNASSVSFVTHVAKLTHSAIDSTSFYDLSSSVDKKALTTSSLNEVLLDGAVQGNQYSPIYQFLELECNGDKLAGVLANKESLALKAYAGSDLMLAKWNEGFLKATEPRDVKAHPLLKQVFYPVDEHKEKYHLLCNINSSSLAHSIFLSLKKNQESILKKKDKSKYLSGTLDYYFNQAQLSITASNHGNASQLNGKRGGKLTLFSCQPPEWKNQLSPPINDKTLFSACDIYLNTKSDIEYLRDYLLRFEQWSIKAPDRKKWIEGWLENIIDSMLFYVASIHELPAGWSQAAEVRMPVEHQYLLDPYREDEEFQANRQSKDWQEKICIDFAHWLNSQLAGKDKKFTPKAEHTKLWRSLMSDPLREFNELIELGISLPKGADV